ncbi:MAG: iron-sulfur cluster assembly accessory protein [Saprospiraceae bacterium]
MSEVLTESQPTTDTQPLTLTESAIKQLRRIRDEQNISNGHALRVGVKGGGCSGFSYILGFDEAKDDDTSFQIEDLNVVLNKGHALYLMGIEIDWVDGLSNRGFTFNNPNAKSTCGCGTSFSA